MNSLKYKANFIFSLLFKEWQALIVRLCIFHLFVDLPPGTKCSLTHPSCDGWSLMVAASNISRVNLLVTMRWTYEYELDVEHLETETTYHQDLVLDNISTCRLNVKPSLVGTAEKISPVFFFQRTYIYNLTYFYLRECLLDVYFDFIHFPVSNTPICRSIYSYSSATFKKYNLTLFLFTLFHFRYLWSPSTWKNTMVMSITCKQFL